MSELKVQIFQSFEPLGALRDEWNELARAVNLGPAEEFDWHKTLWELHGANRQLLLLVVRDAEGITGIAPLVKETDRRKGVPVHLLRMLGGFHALHGTPFLLGRRKQETMNVLLKFLNEHHEGWALWFTSYVSGDEQETMFFSALGNRGYSFTKAPGERSPYLQLRETYEEKVRTLQPRFRTALRSREKRLREKGKMELRFLDSVDLWEEGLDAIREVEEDSWKIESGTAITAQNFQWEFYRRYAPIAARVGTLRIPVLYLNGDPLSYDFALFDRGVYYLMKTSYKRKWQDLYPGFVLRKLLVEWTYSRQGREIDFLGKDEDWKMKWTDKVRQHVAHIVFNRGLTGRYVYAWHRAATWLRN